DDNAGGESSIGGAGGCGIGGGGTLKFGGKATTCGGICVVTNDVCCLSTAGLGGTGGFLSGPGANGGETVVDTGVTDAEIGV
uniref:Uncharacterized protein n=1 Tax=Parascaris equorum TaxID=6256 RepID=A0A914S645_PAREQ